MTRIILADAFFTPTFFCEPQILWVHSGQELQRVKTVDATGGEAKDLLALLGVQAGAPLVQRRPPTLIARRQQADRPVGTGHEAVGSEGPQC